MINYLIIYFILFIISFCLITYNIRKYNIKQYLLWLLSKIQGISNIKYITDINMIEIESILQSTTKGKFIEYHIAMPAWYPIISLESCDNDLWKEVKSNFLIFIQYLENRNNHKNTLKYIIKNNLNGIIEHACKSNDKIDSIAISKLVCKSICEYLFDYLISESELNIIYIGSLEWKKEISCKGIGNTINKWNAINTILSIIVKNTDVYNIFSNQWNDPEYFSVIMQPFIISPMINISDIMCNAEILLNNKQINIIDNIINKDIINKIIYSYHPFPILERYNTTTDTQYFIPLDTLINSNNYSKLTSMLVFGSGPRKCSGIKYAYDILEPLLADYFQNYKLYEPSKNHKYSGRINDNVFYLNQLMYMGYIFCKVILITIWLRIIKHIKLF